MLIQLKTYSSNIIAIDVLESFTEVDEQYLRKLFKEKLEESYDKLNLLIKLDEGKIPEVHLNVFFEHLHFIANNVKHVHHLALVAHSKTVAHLVPLIQKITHTGEKRYFDLSEIDEAFLFVETV
ncbi:SpoIIAA family protein [Tenacibaculum amylolyticum]|uniref:STAS/SEC14 domain-containing protein n=1 Tax=Tenacibaculum amylolyticum TaxID=104269 RepID=UPI0038952856